MSLFGSFFGDDPYFAGTNQLMRQMDTMMNSMLQDSFPSLMPMQQIMGPPVQGQTSRALTPFGTMGGFAFSDPFGLPSMGQVFQSFNQPGCQMFSSSSMMTMTTGPDGRPQVYQASTSTQSGPGGVREVRKTVSDSRSGVRKMTVGRHLGERGHVLEKEQNYLTGDAEEREDFINIDEEEAAHFNEEWTRRAQTTMYGGRPRVEMTRHMVPEPRYSSGTQQPLAITAAPHHESDRHRSRTHPRSIGPERHARKRDGGHRSGKSRHETSM